MSGDRKAARMNVGFLPTLMLCVLLALCVQNSFNSPVAFWDFLHVLNRNERHPLMAKSLGSEDYVG